MPKVNWGVDSETVDDWDRESQYKPYTGPVPPNAVYQWRVKLAQYVAATRGKKPQLRIGLELVPRKGYDEKGYSDFFVMLFLPIAPKTEFRYVPLLDALGVTGREFVNRTVTDEEGNIRKIGKWKNDGNTLILGQLADEADQNGDPRKTVKWMGALDSEPESDDEDEYESDEEDEEEPF